MDQEQHIGCAATKRDQTEYSAENQGMSVASNRTASGSSANMLGTSKAPARIQRTSSDESIRVTEKSHKCDFCHRTFRLLSSIKRHVAKHIGKENSHKCRFCEKRFNQWNLLNFHLKGCRIFRCKKFHQKCRKLNASKQHMETKIEFSRRKLLSVNKRRLEMNGTDQETNIMLFKCPVCAEQYTNYSQLKKHFGQHHGSHGSEGTLSKYQCWLCLKVFRQQRNKVEHEIICHARPELTRKNKLAAVSLENTVLFKCHICIEQYTRKDDLINHLNKHSGDKHESFGQKYQYRCDKCQILFASERNRAKHQNICLRKSVFVRKLFRCCICGQLFNTRILLVHLYKHTNVEHKFQITSTEFYNCNSCSALLVLQPNMTTHSHTCVKTNREDEYNCKLTSELMVGQPNKSTLEHKGVNTDTSREEEYNCKFCSKIFSKKRYSVQHQKRCKSRNFTTRNMYRCRACKEHFTTNQRLQKHLKKEHNDEEIQVQYAGTDFYKCEFCDQLFAWETNELTHTHNCPISGTVPAGSENVNFVDQEQILCDLCGKVFTSMPELRYHIINHIHCFHKCKICRKVVYSKLDLEQHMSTHSFICKKCGLEFNQYRELRNHMHKHRQRKRRYRKYDKGICHICGKVLQEKYLHKHILDQHTLTDRKNLEPFVCHICGKQISSKEGLVRHIQLHDKIKPYRCSFCTDCFPTEYFLKAHVRRCHSARSIKCKFCTATFKSRSSVTRHEKKHDRERTEKCHICDKAFFEKEVLEAHMTIHTKVESYKCDICDRTFARLSSFQRHKKIHSGDKRHECNVCHKRFVQKYALTRHMLVHTGEKPHKCDMCSKQFRQIFLLKQHKKKHHN